MYCRHISALCSINDTFVYKPTSKSEPLAKSKSVKPAKMPAQLRHAQAPISDACTFSCNENPHPTTELPLCRPLFPGVQKEAVFPPFCHEKPLINENLHYLRPRHATISKTSNKCFFLSKSKLSVKAEKNRDWRKKINGRCLFPFPILINLYHPPKKRTTVSYQNPTQQTPSSPKNTPEQTREKTHIIRRHTKLRLNILTRDLEMLSQLTWFGPLPGVSVT